MINKNYNSDDMCDIYEKKICDNCGKCLEIDGVDIRAINIEDIAKNVEENQYLEEQLKEAKELLNTDDDENNASEAEYSFENTSNAENEEDYKDAFDDIVYLDDIGIDADSNLDELTEEIYPGIRKYKH